MWEQDKVKGRGDGRTIKRGREERRHQENECGYQSKGIKRKR